MCFLSVTFPHSEGVLPNLGSCSPVARLQQRSDSGPPCQPPDPSVPSAAGQTRTNSRSTNTQNTLRVFVCVCVRSYMSLHGVLVQLQVLFGGSLLHELRAELIDLVSAPGHSVCHHLRTASLLLQLQLQTLQLVLTETR